MTKPLIEGTIDKSKPMFDYARVGGKQWEYCCPNFKIQEDGTQRCANAFITPNHQYCHQCGLKINWEGVSPPIDHIFNSFGDLT